MSKYTAQLKSICESVSGLSAPDNNYNSVISSAAPKIFDFDFPIFDEEYRNVLERKILNHFYFYEIGCETYGMWKMFLDERMNVIMPYYNELYKRQKELLEKNIFTDVDLTETKEGKSTSNGNEKRTGTYAEISGNTRNNYATTSENGENNSEISKTIQESNTINSDKTVNKSTANSYEKNNTGTDNTDVSEHTENSGSDVKAITNANTGKSTTTEIKERNQSNTKWNYLSDTPQGGIDNVQSLNYLTSLEKTTDSLDANENNNINVNMESANEGSETNTYGKIIQSNNTAEKTINLKEKNDSVGSENLTETNTDESTKNNTESETNNESDNRHRETISEEKENYNKNYNTNNTNDTTLNTTDDYVLKIVGKRGNSLWTEMFKSFRENFLNIDRMILDDLTDLFMLLW